MGFGGCGWPSSSNVSLLLLPSFIFINIAPNSSSTSDDATNFKIVQRVKIAPLNGMGYPSLGTKPRKKCPDARLLSLFADR